MHLQTEFKSRLNGEVPEMAGQGVYNLMELKFCDLYWAY